MAKPSRQKMSTHAASIHLAKPAFQDDPIRLVAGALQAEVVQTFQNVGAMKVLAFWRVRGSYQNQLTIISVKIGNINARRYLSERTR